MQVLTTILELPEPGLPWAWKPEAVTPAPRKPVRNDWSNYDDDDLGDTSPLKLALPEGVHAYLELLARSRGTTPAGVLATAGEFLMRTYTPTEFRNVPWFSHCPGETGPLGDWTLRQFEVPLDTAIKASQYCCYSQMSVDDDVFFFTALHYYLRALRARIEPASEPAVKIKRPQLPGDGHPGLWEYLLSRMPGDETPYLPEPETVDEIEEENPLADVPMPPRLVMPREKVRPQLRVV